MFHWEMILISGNTAQLIISIVSRVQVLALHAYQIFVCISCTTAAANFKFAIRGHFVRVCRRRWNEIAMDWIQANMCRSTKKYSLLSSLFPLRTRAKRISNRFRSQATKVVQLRFGATHAFNMYVYFYRKMVHTTEMVCHSSHVVTSLKTFLEKLI